MWDWFYDKFWLSMTLGKLLTGLGIFVGSIVASLIIVAIVIVKLPYNYFSPHYQQDFLPGASWLARWGATVAKNALGLLLVLAGIVMLIGPGQGILTILIGLILMDIPGKKPFEARLMRKPAILAAANRLRARYGKEPFELD